MGKQKSVPVSIKEIPDIEQKQVAIKQSIINIPKIQLSSLNYLGIFVRMINGKYVKIGQKKIKSTDDVIQFMGKTFPVTATINRKDDKGTTKEFKEVTIAYQEKNRNLIFFDYDGKVLNFSGHDIPISVHDLADLVSKNIVAGIFSRIGLALEKTSLTGKIMPWIIGGIAGGAIGYIIRGSLGVPV